MLMALSGLENLRSLGIYVHSTAYAVAALLPSTTREAVICRSETKGERLMPEPDACGPLAAYARGCLAAARADRDWFRAAVSRLEAAGERIVQTGQPGHDGGARAILDWRTGATLATVTGGQEDDEAVWREGWTDVCWIGAWLEDVADDGLPGPDWPEILPPPPSRNPPPPLALPLPGSLADLLEDAVETWAVDADVSAGRVAEVAKLAGWSTDEVLACTASWLTITGERYMRLGATREEGPAPMPPPSSSPRTTQGRRAKRQRGRG
jgi:hypothetical protein